MNKPIRRHESLQSLSREHHQALLLCWKIRKGITMGVSPFRIKKYMDWFFQNYLAKHFDLEEQHIFPILGNDHELVKQAVSEHRKLESLISEQDYSNELLEEFAATLEGHVRFEERILFNEIQERASGEQLATIESIHTEEAFSETRDDLFWL